MSPQWLQIFSCGGKAAEKKQESCEHHKQHMVYDSLFMAQMAFPGEAQQGSRLQ